MPPWPKQRSIKGFSPVWRGGLGPRRCPDLSNPSRHLWDELIKALQGSIKVCCGQVPKKVPWKSLPMRVEATDGFRFSVVHTLHVHVVSYFFFKCTCVCYLLCNTSLPAMFRNLASISARQGPSDRQRDRARESDGGQMKGGRQREGGERARASRGGLNSPPQSETGTEMERGSDRSAQSGFFHI